MNLIVGLGNPGNRYRFSRHNFGFIVLDELAVRHGITVKKMSFGALVGDGLIFNVKTILAKPQSYMNLSGDAVRNLSLYYQVDLANIMVLHDDLDLPLGIIRFKRGGGAGGHKGLASVIDALGSPDFVRLRLGIGKPQEKEKIEGYVLDFFSAEEIPGVPLIVTRACEAIEDKLQFGLQAAMARYHVRTKINHKEVKNGLE